AQHARTIAARACEAELHRAGHLTHLAGPVALRTRNLARAGRSRPVAGAAGLVARDVQARLCTSDGLPEIDVHHIFEIAAPFPLRLFLSTASAKELRKHVAKTAAARLGAPAAFRSPRASGEVVRKIEAAEIHSRVRTRALRAARSGARETVLRI